MLVLAIVMSVVLTGMVLSLAWVASVQAQTSAQYPKLDGAFYAAETGIQHAVWKFKNDNQWRATAVAPFTGSVTMLGEAYTYSVTATDAVGNATLAWSFNEGSGATTADTTGRGNTGTFQGGATWTTPGRSGAAIRLNGRTAYVNCGNNASTNLTGDVSFSAWFRLSSAAYDQKIGANQNGSFGGYKLCIYNSKVEFEVRDASNIPWLNRNIAGGTIFTMGSWFHVVGVYSDSGHWIKTYVNGQLDREMTGLPVNALGSTTGTFVIGREPFDSSLYFFGGDIDDIRVFNRVLSEQEILALYDTTIDITATATNGRVSNSMGVSCSIPTPPPPTVPALMIDSALTLKNVTINGDLEVDGNLTGQSGGATINGNVTYSGTLGGASYLTITGTTTRAAVTEPVIDYTAVKAQATNYGQTVNGNSSGDTYNFGSLRGSKVIWIKGNLTNPTVEFSGVAPAGGTFIVDGDLKFNGSEAKNLGTSGYPVNFIVLGNVNQTGPGRVTLMGSIYATGNWTRRNCDITGNIWISGSVTDSSTSTSTFSAATPPWFDSRVSAAPTASLPVYYTGIHGGMP